MPDKPLIGKPPQWPLRRVVGVWNAFYGRDQAIAPRKKEGPPADFAIKAFAKMGCVRSWDLSDG